MRYSINWSVQFGILLAIFTLGFGVFKTTPDVSLFLDSHALILVFCGTLAATFIALPGGQLVRLIDMVIFGMLLKTKVGNNSLVKELVEITNNFYSNPKMLSLDKPETHPFIRDAIHLLKKKNIDSHHGVQILEATMEGVHLSYTADAKAIQSIAKFPPAFGLLGATTGMIAMMLNLKDGGSEMIGKAMAIALVATFWGIGVANFVLLPIADYAARVGKEDNFKRHLIVEWYKMIKAEKDINLITQTLSAYLTMYDRFYSREEFRASQDETYIDEKAQGTEIG